LSSERIAKIIQRVGVIDANMAQAMCRLAEYFDYPTLFKLLEEAENG
jgi:hypothetical protein